MKEEANDYLADVEEEPDLPIGIEIKNLRKVFKVSRVREPFLLCAFWIRRERRTELLVFSFLLMSGNLVSKETACAVSVLNANNWFRPHRLSWHLTLVSANHAFSNYIIQAYFIRSKRAFRNNDKNYICNSVN